MKENKNLISESAEQKLKEFAEELIKEKNFEDLDEEVKKQLTEDLYERLEERINAVILASIPAEKIPELDSLLETGTKEEISNFCLEQIPNISEVMTEALTSFKAIYLQK